MSDFCCSSFITRSILSCFSSVWELKAYHFLLLIFSSLVLLYFKTKYELTLDYSKISNLDFKLIALMNNFDLIHFKLFFYSFEPTVSHYDFYLHQTICSHAIMFLFYPRAYSIKLLIVFFYFI
jgi:hypothetical protein